MTLSQLLDLTPLLPLLLLPLTQLVAAWSKRRVLQAFGWWGVPLTTGWIGVPVHELSHVLAARLLGRQVDRVQWFAPDAESGNLGAVHWQPGSGPLAWLAVFAVGFAPLLGGALCLRALLEGAAWALGLPLPQAPASSDWPAWHSSGVALASWAAAATTSVWRRADPLAWSAVAGWWTVVSIAAHLSPSSSDLRGTWRGALLLAATALVAVMGCELAEIAWQPALIRAGLALAWLLAPGLLLAIPAGLALGAAATVVSWLRPR